MPSPFTWDPTRPASGDALSAYPALAQGDKATLRNVLRTLVPFGAGTISIGWRVIQNNNDISSTYNAVTTDGITWTRDDIAVDSFRIWVNGTAGTRIFEVDYAAAAAGNITWTTLAQFTSVASAVNYVNLLAAVTANRVQIQALGTDANIDLDLVPKGTGICRVKNVIIAPDNSSISASGAPATSSLTFVSSGLGVTITPISTGKVLVTINMQGSSNTAGSGGAIRIFRNTTGVPAAGTSVGTDTIISDAANATSIAINTVVSMSLTFLDTGLALGTAVTYYMAMAAVNSGTFSASGGRTVAAEI